jgi:hypothetical protein
MTMRDAAASAIISTLLIGGCVDTETEECLITSNDGDSATLQCGNESLSVPVREASQFAGVYDGQYTEVATRTRTWFSTNNDPTPNGTATVNSSGTQSLSAVEIGGSLYLRDLYNCDYVPVVADGNTLTLAEPTTSSSISNEENGAGFDYETSIDALTAQLTDTGVLTVEIDALTLNTLRESDGTRSEMELDIEYVFVGTRR